MSKTKNKATVYGYVRKNFDKKCWIDEIIATIIQFFVIKGGSLYVCGYGGGGRLGIEKYKNDTCRTPTLCLPFDKNNALKISVSDNYTLIIDTEGDVWCCGEGTYAQLGTGKTNNLYVPIKLNMGIRVIEVSAGRQHSLLLCEDGTVRGCGSNKCGQIGLGNLMEALVPKKIEKLKKYKVIQICVGLNYSAALTDDGDFFCFGDNWNGQCGVGKEKGKYIKTPTKVDFDDEIEFVECGRVHTLVISCKGLTFSFGSGNYGKLGHGNTENKGVPTLIDSLEKKRMIRCAAGYSHSLCIDEEGIIWSFGMNARGQCGSSEDVRVKITPQMIEWFIENNIKGKECFAGWNASSIIATDGCLYSFGCNYNYQLGLKVGMDYYTPTRLPVSFSQNTTVQSISLGADHSAIICDTIHR